MVGKFSKWIKNEDLLKRWKRENYTREELFDNVSHFVESVNDGSFLEKGYMKSAYGMSKLAINIYGSILGKNKEVVEKGIQVYNLCPGYVNTDMTSHKGHLTVDQGAETPLFLINLPFEVNN